MSVPLHSLGPWELFPLGLGCMNVSWSGGAATDSTRRKESAIAGIHAGLDAGVRFLDTADIYAPAWNQVGHNEIFVAEALASWAAPAEVKDSVVIATKGGITRSEGEKWGRNGSRDYLVAAAEASRERLGVEVLDLWQHHRLDPSLAFETQCENVGHLKERGLVSQIGVSNYSAAQLRRAIEVLGGPAEGGVVSLQNEFSPFYRHDLDVLEVCEEWGIAFLPWSPLGGSQNVAGLGSDPSSGLARVATEKGVTPSALALAWLLSYSPVIIPIPGATRAESIRDCVSAVFLELEPEEQEAISASLPVSAPRSDELEPTAPFVS